MRPITCALLTLFLGGAPLYAQLPGLPGMPRDAAAQKAGTAQLSGRVLGAESGRPLRRATVRAMSEGMREPRSATTDAQGRWTIKGLAPGKYTLTVTKGGYVTLSYGQKRPFEQGQPIDVANAQVLEKLDISLPKGGVITGRIQDEFGEPFAGIRVSTMRYRYLNGQRRLVSVGVTDTTDDIGQFRLHGLSPGDYYVSASNASMSFDISEDRLGYATTYFPGTTMFGDAQKITVVEGQETPNINFDLAPTRVATISGTATTSQGKPLANALVMMTSPMVQAGIPTISPAMVRPDGSFSISNVTPGEYRLETFSIGDMQALASGISGPAELASMPLTVTGEDITGLTLASIPTSAATGKIVFEGEPDPKVTPGSLMVMGMAPVMTSFIPGGMGKVKDDWTFEARGMIERRIFRVNPPPGWFLKKITVNDTDVTDTGIDFKSGEDVSGIEIVMTRQMATLDGTATKDGKPTGDFVVVAFASDRGRWGPATRYVRTAKPDQNGRFTITGLPAEDYMVAALEYMETGEEADPDFLERVRANATRVRVDEGATKTVTLKVTR
jgi:protocatechuate 3,4-dioxygenase beta subunit